VLFVYGGLGLLATGADTVRLFAKAEDHSPVALLVWALWGLALVAPLAWVARQQVRARALGPDLAPAVRDELSRSAAGALLLGYGLAVFALRVVELCLRR